MPLVDRLLEVKAVKERKMREKSSSRMKLTGEDAIFLRL
jgi:hypothetical protein